MKRACIDTNDTSAHQYQDKTNKRQSASSDPSTFSCHSKKSDKETQSPVLKLFRDMMQKEKHDPEKTNLLNSKQEKKKKKHSGSRSKSNKSVTTSCSERQDTPYKGNQSLMNAEFDPIRTQSTPYQSEKRESWWFWGDTSEKPVSDKTCSCVSCALKKLISTDYACMACLVLLFVVSVLVAFLLVYKSIPCMTETFGSQKSESDRPKRKIEGSRIRWNQLGEEGGPNWNNRKSSFGVPQSMDVSDIQDMSSLVNSNSELVKILDNDLMSEIQSSDQLREFYKKLIKTDAQIQNLKKNNDLDGNNIENFDKYQLYPERAKRSLKIFHRPQNLLHFKRNKHIKDNKPNDKHNDKTNKDSNKNKENNKVIAETKDSNHNNIKTSRNKRFDNDSEPEGFVIENKKVLIQYKPSRKSKCSHAPKDSKSHEKQLKHPFYQNTQRLDELLDKFIDKNLPEILDPFGLDLIFEKTKKCKHPKLDEGSADKKAIKNDKAITNDKEKGDFEIFKHDKDITELSKTESNTARSIFAEEFDDGIKRETITNAYGLLTSVSTLMYPGNNDNLKRTTYLPLIDRVPNRKLLQTDSDDDVNEVIIDARDVNDSVDANGPVNDNSEPDDKKKQMDESNMDVSNYKLQNNPATIVNPNWKGPMPLYPDELNSMVKQETRDNRVEYPVHSKYNSNEEPVGHSEGKYANVNQNINRVETLLNKDTLSETDELEGDINDVDYIEDYFRNKYDKLVEMAQAYSDYGVLEGKKITDKKVDDKIKTEEPDRRIKQTLTGLKTGLKNSIFGRSKKGSHNNPFGNQNSAWEGFKFEILPNSATRDDYPIDFYKALQKHVKLTNRKPNQYDTPINAQIKDLMYSQAVEPKTTKKNENGIIFAIGNGKRTLKSVNEELVSEENEASAVEKPSVKNNDTIVDVEETTRNVVENVHLRHKREVDQDGVTIDRDIRSIDCESQTEISARDLVDVDKAINPFNDTENVLNKRQKHEASNNSLTDIQSSDEFTKINNDYEKTLNLSKDESNRNDSMSLSNFFMMLANWFSDLDGVDSLNLSGNENLSALNKTIKGMNNSEIIYPIYDAEMIENIGHRSRVLLSVEDVTTTATELDKKQTIDDTTDKTTNITNLSIINNDNKTKAIVKRNADDSNLVFWNDLYDDEYGVIDDTERKREKYSVNNDFMKKPNVWFRDKVKKIADGIHKKAESFKKDHFDGKKAKDKISEDNMKTKQKAAISNRVSRNVDGSGAQKTDFAALTANMKKICRKAAKDVALANKVDVRDVSKDGQVTSSLMQHLVRLMGDLVDYQVKQRTCRKLPADLQNFLEWLTSPNDTDKYSSGYKTDYSEIDLDKMNDKPEDHTIDLAPIEREEKPDSRSDCLGTLQSVRALMKQYEELTDDDKSKMTGVKEYLDNQMDYLQKQISYNEVNSYNTDPIRYRRDVSKTLKDQKPMKKKRLKQIFSNLMKKLGRKQHNNSNKNTNNNVKNDIDDTSGIKNNMKETNNESKTVREKEKDINSKNVREKMNLQDVYFKAVEDAKKLTTVESNK